MGRKVSMIACGLRTEEQAYANMRPSAGIVFLSLMLSAVWLPIPAGSAGCAFGPRLKRSGAKIPAVPVTCLEVAVWKNAPAGVV